MNSVKEPSVPLTQVLYQSETFPNAKDISQMNSLGMPYADCSGKAPTISIHLNDTIYVKATQSVAKLYYGLILRPSAMA